MPLKSHRFHITHIGNDASAAVVCLRPGSCTSCCPPVCDLVNNSDVLIQERKGRLLVSCAVKDGLVFLHLLQSWSQSRPPPPSPPCPSTSSSTARTSGRTCVCWASPRESSPGFFTSLKTGFCCSLVCHGCFSALRFISHGITHCYSSFRGDVRGTAPSLYWMYLLTVCAGGGAWLLLWATVDRCGRRGILLLSMTMMGLASLILLGLMKCKWASVVSRTFVF